MARISLKKQTLKRLLLEFTTQSHLILVAVLGTLIQVGLTVYLPVLIGRILDSLLEAHALVAIFRLLSYMTVVILGNALLQWILPLIYNRLVYGLVSSLRQKVLDQVHGLPFSYLDRQSVGDMVSRVTTDSEQLTNGLLMVFNQFFVGFITILMTVISMARMDILMLILVLALSPLSLLVAKFIAQKSYFLYQEQTRARGRQTQLLEESLSQHALIQTLNAQNQLDRNFKALNHSYANKSQGAIFYASIVNPATRFVNALIYALLAALGAIRIMSGQFTVGQLIAFLNYATQYSKPFNDISSVLAEWQSAVACAERLYDILDAPTLNEDGKEPLMTETLEGAISFEDVSFGYEPDKPLIQNLNLSIPAGSKVAIVGPTGAGKSTLVNLLMRFYEVDGGKILLDDVDMANYSRQSLRQQFGMVLQETWLKRATIHDNIAYGRPEASREEVIAAAKSANADFFIRQLPKGYDTYLTDAGGSLSQGQAQLLAIARVFFKAPKFLILDEATSSIDTRTELLVQQAFDRLMANRTSFIIAHRLSTIEKADMILVMVAGKIVEWGSHKELLAKKGAYYQMQVAQEIQSN